MTVTLEDWRRLYEICDHRDRLHNDDLDLFVERPDSVARRIAETLRDGFETRGNWLVCGSVGAGKSSELIRLYQLLRDDFVVVGVDLERSTGKIEQIAPAEILFCIGAAAVRTVKERFDHNVDGDLIEELCRAFEGLLELLISKSGGLLRQLIMLLRNAAREAGRQRRARVELDTAAAVCDELRKDFEITMTRERREELEYIAEYGEPQGGPISSELLLWNYAFPYSNGRAWFAPNPLINLSRRRP